MSQVDEYNIVIGLFMIRRLFELYFIQGLSLRAISKGAKIGLTSIHTLYTKPKSYIKRAVYQKI